MFCHVCKSNFSNPNILVRHLQKVHRNINTFKCTLAGCGQIFEFAYNFKRHIKRHHPQIQNCAKTEVPKPSTSTNKNIEINEVLEKNIVPVQITKPKIPIPNLEIGPMKLTLECHNNNNFTRKNVLVIQNQIKEYITQPIMHGLQSLGSQHENLCQSSDYLDILQFCKDPFSNFNSEH